MTYRYSLPALALLALAPTVRAVDPADLKPGLVATFHGPGNDRAARLEPTVALTLQPGEAAHPRLPADPGSETHWRGYINVVRPGKYRFAAVVTGGDFFAEVNGKRVLSASPNAQKNDEVQLEGGVQPFMAAFKRSGKAARVELQWEGPGFRKEPIPYQFFGHLPKEAPPELLRDVQLDHGRFRFEELACVRCHKPDPTDKMAKGLADRPGPNLTDVAKRSHAGWIDAWLADPARLRPHTAMPRMFTSDGAGQSERYAVVRYLVSLAGRPLSPVKAPTLDGGYRDSMNRGKTLFTVAGCAACHDEPKPSAKGDDEDRDPLKPEDFVYSAGTAGPSAKYKLGAVGSKYRPDTLTAYLQYPLKVNPSGRMPHMNLNGQDAQDIARYLCRLTDETIEPGMPPAPKGSQRTDAQWIEEGRKVVIAKGCVNCHAIEPGGKAILAVTRFSPLAALPKAGAAGCLQQSPNPAKTPAYTLTAPERQAIGFFLKEGLTGAGTAAPTHAARLTIRRFNCLNCHSKDGEGGLSTELADTMRLMAKAENADDIRPPLLTGIGHKSRTSWLKSVITQSGRARPWMQLRMPQYGEGNVGQLPESLALMEGTITDDTVRQIALTPEKVTAGRQIVGKGGLGCISCHDIAGVPNTGTRGPDLATISQRVRYDWYERWLHQPMRMAPGTRMPQAFIDNKSTLATVLNGDAVRQAEAMWAYLSLGPGLPLPEGMEPPKGLIVAATEHPEVLRTFMPDAGSKAIAVGYPGGVSVAFSADQCRLSYAWAGNFLDASPVWANRGGSPAKLLGPKFWTAPPGHPWGLTVNPRIPPDFVGRANNPAFGLPLPLEPARIYNGPRAVRFDGYSVGKDGNPTFRYRLVEGDGELKVAESPLPLKATVAAGIRRTFEVEAKAGYQVWLLAGISSKQPRAIVAGVDTATPVPNATEATLGVANTKLVLPDGDRATVVEAVGVPNGTTWRLVPRPGGGSLAVLRLPEGKTPLKATFTLNVWGLPRDDDALLKGLAGK